MKVQLVFLVFTILLSLNLGAQTQKQMEEKREEIKRLFGEDFFKDIEEFDKRYQELMKELFETGHGGGTLLDDEVLDQFMQKMKPHEYLEEGDIKWIENDKQKILMLKFKQDQNSPLNIAIEKGMIQVSGTITQKEEKREGGSSSFSSFTSTFSRAFEIPQDVEERSAKIENKNGEITISFDKKNQNASKKDVKKPKAKPLLFKKDEKTI
jgi:HSP20 family molecular chaperone IbpA